MGDPRKSKKKYSGPGHPWQGDRISAERELLEEYGLKNKKELWKVASLLRNWRTQARKMISLPEAEREEAQKVLIGKLHTMGLVDKDAQLDDVLSLDTKDLLERRLQTQVHKDGMSNSVKQARQFIVHGKVTVNGDVTSSPAHLLKTSDKFGLAGDFKPTLKKVVKGAVFPGKKPEEDKPAEVKEEPVAVETEKPAEVAPVEEKLAEVKEDIALDEQTHK